MSRIARIGAFLALALVAGCLKVPGSEPAPMCYSKDDCDAAAGEVCDEGVCWGAAPDSDYAAVIGPPYTTRSDLVATEIPNVSIALDGWMQNLQVESAVTLTGVVRLACVLGGPDCNDAVAVPAAVRVTRGSRIPGGPGFDTTTDSVPGSEGELSFALALPPPGPDDPPYQLTITPAFVEDDASINPAEIAPPLHFTLAKGAELDALDIILGAGPLRRVSGRVVDAAGHGLARWRVIANGRWDDADPLAQVSTVGFTDAEGRFQIFLAADAKPVIDVKATPPSSMPAPTLRLHDFDASGADENAGDLRVPSFSDPVPYTVPVIGYETDGSEVPVVGAKVWLRTEVSDGLGRANLTAVHEVEGDTDENGEVHVQLLRGAPASGRTYTLRIHPPPESKLATVYDQPLTIGPNSGYTEQVRVPDRVAIIGVVVDSAGVPVEGVNVVARPALHFNWRIDDGLRSQLASVVPPTTQTTSDGSFILFVDPDVAGLEPQYDLECDPAAGSLQPRWTRRDVGAGSDVEIRLPEPAYVRGRVVDVNGERIGGAEVRILAPAQTEPCPASLPDAVDCDTPAEILAFEQSDDDGVVRLVLPRVIR